MQNHGNVRSRGARHHIPSVLFMTRRIGNDELTPLGREEAVGDIDGNSLLAFRRQAIDQQREVELLAARADFFRIHVERGELIVKNHFRFV